MYQKKRNLNHTSLSKSIKNPKSDIVMKKFLLMLLKMFAVVLVQAQAPAEINYQGVARNPAGLALANQNISLRISIRNSSSTGTIEYQETRKVKTNGFGLFNIAIGSNGAMNVTGAINSIGWSDGVRRYVQVEIDPAAGYTFKNMGAAQLLSVPYALYAGSASPSGVAGGSLKGNFPNPTIADNAVTTSVIADNAITTAKIDNGAVTDIKIADGSVTTSKIANGAITSNTLADGAVTAEKLGNGSVTTEKVANAAVTTEKIANASVTTGKIANANITEEKIADGSVTTAKIMNAAVTTEKIADTSVGTSNIKDGSVTLAKLGPDVIMNGGSGSSPTGSAGGDLNGNYPNPTIASHAVTNSKIANGAVVTPKIADGAVTASKIADGTITAAKLAPGVVSNFSLPYTSTQSNTSNLFSITNQGTAAAIEGVNSSSSNNVIGVSGKISAATPGVDVAAVKGTVTGNGIEGFGVWGAHANNGTGVYGTSVNGSGVYGKTTGGNAVLGSSVTGVGVFGTSEQGLPGLFNIASTSNFNDALFASNAGYGNGIVALSTYSNGVLGIANDLAGAGIFGINNAGGEGVVGRGFSDFAAAVVGRNDGTYAGVRAVNASPNGTALLAQANVDGAFNGTALTAELEGSNAGNIAVFKANGVNVARIDHTGKAYFNNSTQVGGADVAEYFAVEGDRNAYEPGDVLVISTNSDRTVEKSSAAYSNLVSGVYATKAGLLLTEENAEKDDLDKFVPMGVIGVIPVKVNLEGGAIRRGDMLVTSSQSGVAMKGDLDKIKVGQVIGKALQDYNGAGNGKINVLVSIK
jgi:hypothetical protein